MAKKLHPPPPGDPGQRNLPEDPEPENTIPEEEETEDEEGN